MKNEVLVGTRKVKRDEVINENLIYVLKGRVFLDKPKFTEITKYMVNDETGEMYAILKKVNWIPHILLMILIMFLSFKIEAQVEQVQLVNYTDVIKAKNGLIGVNVSNPESNMYTANISVKYGEEYLTEVVCLKPGESVGNLELQQEVDLPCGSYMCELMYSATVGQLVMASTKYDVVLVVE